MLIIHNNTANMETLSLPTVLFGKYKGQPITELLNDTKYLDWCKQQPWFQKFPIVYNICVNQTITTTNNPSSKTPEHNKLQNLFLENENTIKLIRRVLFNKTGKYSTKIVYDFRVVFETIFNWDVLIENISIYKCICDNDICQGCDGSDYREYNDICIEIKPILGDDYPCVLRKMKTQMELTKHEYTDKEEKCIFIKYKFIPKFVLLIKEYSSSTTSKEQLIQIFQQSRIHVVFIDELFNKVPNQRVITSETSIVAPETLSIEDENVLLRKTLLQAQERIKQLENEIIVLKTPPAQKQSKTIRDFFGKK